ncbi:MAG: alkaline phosphatase PhoX [Sphingomonadales bacterium]
MTATRRTFLKGSIATGLAFGGLAAYFGYRYYNQPYKPGKNGYGPLVDDPLGLLSLPKGFQYRVLSRTGQEMSDGLWLPGRPDGMATFPGPGGKVIAVRNHELTAGDTDTSPYGADESRFKLVDPSRLYDAGEPGARQLGGTTTFVFNPETRLIEKQFMSLGGTLRNCAGGPTPWGSWLSCEETVWLTGRDGRQKNHGYVFEVPARTDGGLVDPVPLKDMGRFMHEAAAVDPRTGVVYLTEDQNEALFYRFLPRRPGELEAGGRLQALAVKGREGLDTRNWDDITVKPGDELEVYWIDLENPDPPENTLRLEGHADGAAIFARGEGAWFGNGELYFACTSGGADELGQIWRYRPSPNEGTAGESEAPGRLTLFVESNDDELMEMVDNITVAPWGDLIICEDGPGQDYLRGVTPEGDIYTFGRNDSSGSEFAGACFTPDGKTLLVNMQTDEVTVAIWGPWDGRG